MFTKCPECTAVQKLSAAQLQSGKGLVQCASCYKVFYALEEIRDTADFSTPPPEQKFSWREQPGKRARLPWGMFSGAALLLLVAQLIYFEGDEFTQNSTRRVWLEKFCRTFSCQLPAYQNTADFSILQGQLTPGPNQTVILQTALTNQALFPQPYPHLKVTLMDYAGNAFAQRLLKPKEYLPDATEKMLLAEASTEINLKIVAPAKKIGGYTFDLIF